MSEARLTRNMPQFMSAMKNTARNIIYRMGFLVASIDGLPTGVDECTDIKRLGFEIQTIFDVGANIGLKTLQYVRRWPRSVVYSFEPVLTTFNQLVANVQYSPNVHCVHTALGATSTNEWIYLQEDSGRNSLKPELNLPSRPGDLAVSIQVTTIDEFAASKGISHVDLIKTDTEGFDLQVLQGATRMLSERRIRFVLSEASFRKRDTRHTQFDQLHRFLVPFGFEFCGLYDPKQRRSGLRYCNALFIRVD